MKKWRIYWIVLTMLVFCAGLSACGNDPAETDGSEESLSGEEGRETGEAKTLEDFFPAFATLENLYVIYDSTSGKFPEPRVLVIANGEERAALLECLTTPLEGFAEAEDNNGITGPMVSLRAETEDGNYTIMVVSGETGQMLQITNLSMEALLSPGTVEVQEIHVVGPVGGLPFEDIQRIALEIGENTTDPEYTGTVTCGEEGPKVVNKAQAATARNILDGTLALASSTEGDNSGFGATFESGPYVYRIDPATGAFSREGEGELLYGQVEESWRMRVNMHLKLPLSPDGAEPGTEN